MNKLCKETGFLSQDGNKAVTPLKKALDNLLSIKDVNDMSAEEIRTLGCNLMALVADRISNKIQSMKKKASMFDKMSDEEFKSYLTNKYGQNYFLVGLTHEEYARVKPLNIKTFDFYDIVSQRPDLIYDK